MSQAKIRIAASAMAVAATAGILKAVAVIAAVQGPGSMPVVEMPRVAIVAESPSKAASNVAPTTRGG
jgi:hypothetical protein